MQKIAALKRKLGTGIGLAAALGTILSANPLPVSAAGTLDMSTDYPGITVKAGETVSFDLDFTNEEACDAALSVEELPDGWEGYFRGGSYQITRIHVDDPALAGDSSSATFSLSIPDDTSEGTYTVKLKADAGSGNTDTLDLEIMVNELETGQSDFTVEYPEQEGSSGTSFSFDATIENNRGTEQSYSLSANAPDGWQVSFVPSGESTSVASLTLDSGASQNLSINITPPESINEGEYTIPCTAISSTDTLDMDLKVTITGSYEVELTTPTGLLSFDAYSNAEKAVTLTIKNNGNVALENLSLTSSLPSSWEARFDEDTIETLEAGASKEITAYITPTSDAMTGDYVATLKVSNDMTSSSADFRVSVKTRTAWGLAAVGIIVVLIVGLGLILKKYGRR